MAKKKAVSAPYPDSAMEKDWRAQDDLRTLSRAAEIGADKARVAAAKAEAKRQMQALQRVAGAEKRSGGKKPDPKTARQRRLASVQL